MQRPSKYEMLHAMRYAEERTKLYMMEVSRQRYPQLFQYAHLESRPATQKDYYIPPSLTQESVVVVKTYFEKEGCEKVSCFPFRSDGLPCSQSDSMHWSRVGSSHILCCQPSCQVSEATVDVEWRDQKCVRVNPFKKYIAMFPEMIFDVKTKNPLHFGLEWQNGKLYLNETYCKAYGLEFDGKECVMKLYQTIWELLFGTTAYRGLKIQAISPPKIPPPPPLPKISVDLPEIPTNIPDVPFDYNKFAKEIISEAAFDFGVDIALDVAENILKKRAPKLLAKAANSIPIKAALAHMVLKQSVKLGVKSLITAGKILGMANNAFSLYSIISTVLDIFDPLQFGNVLTMKEVEKISKRLDLLYFEREDNFSPELTPEYMWENILVKEDESDQYEYFASQVNEYLNALRVGDKPTAASELMFDFNFEKENKHWNWTMHTVVMLMLIILAILYVEWIHVWGCLVLLTVLFLKDSS